jgi:hypothetical protein
MKYSSSGLSNNYLKIKLHIIFVQLGSQCYRRYELQYGVVTIDITIFLSYFLGILEKVRYVFFLKIQDELSPEYLRNKIGKL